MGTLSQTAEIRSALSHGQALTPMTALRRFGCLRLAARVADLRAEGMDIDTRIVERGGKRFAEYRVS